MLGVQLRLKTQKWPKSVCSVHLWGFLEPCSADQSKLQRKGAPGLIQLGGEGVEGTGQGQVETMGPWEAVVYDQ